MRAGGGQLNPALLVVLVFKLCFYCSSNSSGLQVCELCNGTVLSDSQVGRVCSVATGRIEGRCCLKNGTSDHQDKIIGLDLSNCSLTQIENLQDASTATIIDLSLNPISNISELLFQGFVDLNSLILPVTVLCPGGATSWKINEEREGKRFCEGQNSMCNQTGQMSTDCPENSQCAPFGPGLFECSCAGNFHGYKCLREGEFPALQVFGPLGATTVVISLALWATQRRKAKPL